MSNFEQFIEYALRADSHLKTDAEITDWVNGLSPADLFDQFESFVARGATIRGSERYENERENADYLSRVTDIMRPRMNAILSDEKPERPASDNAAENTIMGMTESVLITSYDHFNSERERLANSLGGRHLSGDDMKKVEALTEKINLMRTEIASRMTVGA